MNYHPSPDTLIAELSKYGKRATGNAEWDAALLDTLRHQSRSAPTWAALHDVALRARADADKRRELSHDLADPDVYRAHAKLLLHIANLAVLDRQNRTFTVDDNNRQVIRFLLYYFNNCPLAEEVFPGRGYKLHKNILLQGGVGVGKTLLMQIFAEYLHRIKSPRAFHCVSVTQMVNYYTMHNNLDRFTYNEEEQRGFQCMPANVCLNDIGIQDKTFFGMDTGLLTDEFLHARNEIWTQYGKFAHLTTNLDNTQLKQRFSEKNGFGRLVDRFKTYNIIPLTGKSRR